MTILEPKENFQKVTLAQRIAAKNALRVLIQLSAGVQPTFCEMCNDLCAAGLIYYDTNECMYRVTKPGDRALTGLLRQFEQDLYL